VPNRTLPQAMDGLVRLRDGISNRRIFAPMERIDGLERVVVIGAMVSGATLVKPFELKCADYHVEGASIGHSRSGSVFRCTLSPVSDEVLTSLDEVVRSNRMIRFVFPKQPLVLESIEVVRLEPGRIQIAGRVVEGD
jgi:hypothetical protein